jgi:hypothetical protein
LTRRKLIGLAVGIGLLAWIVPGLAVPVTAAATIYGMAKR